jgi:dienelactone hydrolase
LRDTLKAAGREVTEFRHDTYTHTTVHRTPNSAEFHRYFVVIFRYVHADHAFTNEEAPAYPYNKEASDFAMKEAASFFETFLA